MYIFGDDEDAIGGSEELADKLDLVWADVGEGGQDDLFVGSEHLIKSFDCLFLFLSDLSTTSHLINIIWFIKKRLFESLDKEFHFAFIYIIYQKTIDHLQNHLPSIYTFYFFHLCCHQVIKTSTPKVDIYHENFDDRGGDESKNIDVVVNNAHNIFIYQEHIIILSLV